MAACLRSFRDAEATLPGPSRWFLAGPLGATCRLTEDIIEALGGPLKAQQCASAEWQRLRRMKNSIRHVPGTRPWTSRGRSRGA
jgi:hypothetical protein